MKKTILTLSLICGLTGIAYADGNAFTPLNFNDTAYTSSTVSNNSSNAKTSIEGEAIGNGTIQDAIQQLDNAQIDIRNELLNVKTKYADIDAQYKLIKTERASLKKQVKAVEKRIREIDKAKEKIRKNML